MVALSPRKANPNTLANLRRLADVAGHLDGMVMMEEDAASRAREEGGCVGEGAARRGRTAVRVGGGGGGKDFCRNNNGKRTARDEDER